MTAQPEPGTEQPAGARDYPARREFGAWVITLMIIGAFSFLAGAYLDAIHPLSGEDSALTYGSLFFLYGVLTFGIVRYGGRGRQPLPSPDPERPPPS